MAGILDNKHRILDTIITKEGRRQVAAGDLKIRFVSFTDRHTFYEEDCHGCAEDASDRIFLEATHRLQDQIIFETDDDARMVPFEGHDIKVGWGGKLYKVPDGGSVDEAVVANCKDTALLVDELLEGAAQNFRDQQIISTIDRFSETSEFIVSPTTMKFRVTDTFPIPSSKITQADVNDIESLYQDKRLQHLPFYQYLPPVNQPKPGVEEGEPLGRYKKLNQPAVLDISELENALVDRESFQVNFSDTSRANNLVMQFLETNNGEVNKLALIDFGEFPSEDPYSPGKRVFFVGKIFADGVGEHTYVNIFTIILE